ncbi:MAG: hypothetical protein QME58_02540 [Bacteroidota bacterium]|nr:hypothetical protein [Bacteroidota bacterium]
MLSSNLADSLINQNGLKQGDSITFGMISTPNDWFVENQIIRTLQGKSIIDVPLIASGEGSQMQIECAVSKIFVNYSDIYRDGFLGNKKVTRSIGIELSGKILDKNKIKIIQPIYTTYKDTVLFSSINSLEEQYIPATKGIIPDDNIIEKLIIPSVVVSSVAIITYLFFTLRN